MVYYFKNKRLIEDRIKRLSMHFSLELLLLLRHNIDLNVRIGGATHVHSRQLSGLQHADGELLLLEVVVQRELELAQVRHFGLLRLGVLIVLHVCRQLLNVRLNLFNQSLDFFFFTVPFLYYINLIFVYLLFE